VDTASQPSGKHSHDERVGRILNDYVDRLAKGEAVTPTDLMARHPEIAHELREHLALLRELQPADDRIDGLVRQALLSPTQESRYRAMLGPYGILAFIGRGGMGLVLKAHEERLNRTVALKILRPELADDAAALARFEREARAAAGLNHPNIVTIFAIGQEGGTHYIAMEYVAGPSLAELLRTATVRERLSFGPGSRPTSTAIADGPSTDVADEHRSDGQTNFDLRPSASSVDEGLSVPARGMNAAARTELARHVFRGLLSALDAAHRAGLIHRDVKPSNILLDAAVSHQPSAVSAGGSDSTPSAPPSLRGFVASSLPTVKLADFGLARMRAAHTQVTQTGSVLGTPDYMSPEQARGEPNLDQRTDLYSAGVVLYEMLTGRTPFHADSPTATLRRILDDAPAHPRAFTKDADPHLAALALRLLAKRPEERFASAAAALAALDTPGSLSRAARRRRVRLGAGVGTLLLCLIALSVFLTRSAWRGFGRSTNSRIARGLTRVELDPNQPTRRVWARDAQGRGRVLIDLPADIGRADAVALVSNATAGEPVVAVGVERPADLGQGPGNVFGFDVQGQLRWSTLLASDWVWPGCDPPGAWRCTLLQAVNVDGQAGDELLAVASDHVYYPTLIAWVDPRTGQVRPEATFWHAGDLAGVQVELNYFGSERPAVVAWGFNNKLDEAAALHPDWAGPTASYDFVSVLMVLDPRDMGGSGPPPLGPTSPLPTRLPYAYAFLDFPSSRQAVRRGAGGVSEVRPEEVASVAGVNPAHLRGSEASRPWKELNVVDSEARSRMDLVVDRDLNFIAAPLNGEEGLRTTEQDWSDRWRPVVQRGQYVFASPTASPARDVGALTAVMLDEHDAAVLLGRHGQEGAAAVLRRFPSAVHVGSAVLVDVDGAGTRAIAVALSAPEGSDSFLVLDDTGADLWTLDLSDDQVWPDCGPPTRWRCRNLLAADLDGLPGDEIAAIARDYYEYPSRLSVIDPRTRTIRATLWHYGHLSTVHLAPDYFGPGRPALFTFGLNNKLDGFATPDAGDEPSRSRFDVVSVAMVLDPLDLEGVGPPRSARLPGRLPARPYAYAFLDLPAREELQPEQLAVPRTGEAAADPATLMGMALGSYAIPDDSGPWFALTLAQPAGRPGPGVLVVDRHLSVHHFVVSYGETRRASVDYWRDHWRPVVKNFEWLPQE
jgi:serine/threonine protein kinase